METNDTQLSQDASRGRAYTPQPQLEPGKPGRGKPPIGPGLLALALSLGYPLSKYLQLAPKSDEPAPPSSSSAPRQEAAMFAADWTRLRAPGAPGESALALPEAHARHLSAPAFSPEATLPAKTALPRPAAAPRRPDWAKEQSDVRWAWPTRFRGASLSYFHDVQEGRKEIADSTVVSQKLVAWYPSNSEGKRRLFLIETLAGAQEKLYEGELPARLAALEAKRAAAQQRWEAKEAAKEAFRKAAQEEYLKAQEERRIAAAKAEEERLRKNEEQARLAAAHGLQARQRAAEAAKAEKERKAEALRRAWDAATVKAREEAKRRRRVGPQAAMNAFQQAEQRPMNVEPARTTEQPAAQQQAPAEGGPVENQAVAAAVPTAKEQATISETCKRALEQHNLYREYYSPRFGDWFAEHRERGDLFDAVWKRPMNDQEKAFALSCPGCYPSLTRQKKIEWMPSAVALSCPELTGGKQAVSGRILHNVTPQGKYAYEQAALELTFADGSKDIYFGSPLVFDLAGSGVQTGARTSLFDIAGGGKEDKIQFINDIGPGMGLLVFGSGKTNLETFGDKTDLDADGRPDGYQDGFEALKAFVLKAVKEKILPDTVLSAQSLEPGHLSALEKAYGLKVKVGGFNHEPVSPAEAGIKAIALSEAPVETVRNFDGQGNKIAMQSGAVFQRADGTVGAYMDVWLRIK